MYLRVDRNITEVELNSTTNLSCITNDRNATIEWSPSTIDINIISTSRVEEKEAGRDGTSENDIVKSVVQFTAPHLTSPTTLTLTCSTKTMSASSILYFYSELNVIRHTHSHTYN